MPGDSPVIAESLADLVARPLYAHLATVRPDGTPQVNPTWFRFDGEYLWLTTTTRRQKHRNWQLQPPVALSITDPDRPSRYLEIRGRVEQIVPDPDGAEFVRLAQRYGMPQGPTAGCGRPYCRGHPAAAHHHTVTTTRQHQLSSARPSPQSNILSRVWCDLQVKSSATMEVSPRGITGLGR